MNMKIVIGIFGILSASAQASNYPAEQLSIGTEVSVLNTIDFPKKSTGVFIQNGIVLTRESRVIFKDLDSYCSVTVDPSQYHSETGVTNPILKGNYRIERFLDSDISRGSVGWMIASESGNEFHLQCYKSVSLITRAAESLGIAHLISTDNVFEIHIGSVKKSLKGVIKIQD